MIDSDSYEFEKSCKDSMGIPNFKDIYNSGNDSQNISDLQLDEIVNNSKKNKVKGDGNNSLNSIEKNGFIKYREPNNFFLNGIFCKNEDFLENNNHFIGINDSLNIPSIITFDDNEKSYIISEEHKDLNIFKLESFLEDFSKSEDKNCYECDIYQNNQQFLFPSEKNKSKNVLEHEYKNTALTKEKIDKSGENISIILENKSENFYIGKKKAKNKFKNENDFSIFNFGEYSNYSKKKIEESLNSQLKNGYLFEIHEFKYSKKYKKRIKTVRERKENSDNTRKKIKSRFLKILKDKINEKLIAAGSKEIFQFFPQSFVSDITKENNISVLDLTFEEIISKDFNNGKELKNSNLQKSSHNKFMLKYLEKNSSICEKSNFKNIKQMKYKEIFYEYLNSKEFQMEIDNLKRAKESEQYIKKFIIKAFGFIDFFKN